MDKNQFTKELTELIDNWLFKTEHRGFHPTKYRPLCELLWDNGYRKVWEYELDSDKLPINNNASIIRETARSVLNAIGNTPILAKNQGLVDLNESELKALEVFADRIKKAIKKLKKQYGVDYEL